MNEIHVAAGVLVDADGRVLITERVGDTPFAGCWEFPGGKVDGHESPAAALQRELAEELGILVADCDPLLTLSHDYPDRRVRIDFFRVRTWTGEPRGLEGQAIRWVTADDLGRVDLLPADAPVVELLRSEGRGDAAVSRGSDEN